MGTEEIKRIKEKFSELKLHPVYMTHEAVITSEDAARTRGIALRQGIKALLFTNGSGEWVVVDIPADKKADVKKVAAQVGWSHSKTRMATPEEVMENTGCEIGAVPPFGHRKKIQLLVDKGVYENQESTFNIGTRTESLKIPTMEMRIVFQDADAIEGIFAK